jgi:hypothetical protein
MMRANRPAFWTGGRHGHKRIFNRSCTQMNADKGSLTHVKLAGFDTWPLISSAFICVHLWLKFLACISGRIHRQPIQNGLSAA